MTLNLSLVTPRYAIQVSDRRLSRVDRNGKLISYTDDLTKATVLVTRDTFSAITYHGVGMDHSGLRTDDWLVRALTEQKPAEKRLTDVLENLQREASGWISSLSAATGVGQGELRHSFVISGWQFDERPFTFLLSNYEDLKSGELRDIAQPGFRSTFSRPKLGKETAFQLMARGDTRGLPESEGELVSRLAKTPGAKPDDIVNILVKSLRKSAARPHSTVSPDCISVIIERGDHTAKCLFHSSDGARVIHTPHYVGPITISHVKITRGKPIGRAD